MVGLRWSLSSFFLIFDFDFVSYFEKDNQKNRSEMRGQVTTDVNGDRSERVRGECVLE